MEDLEVIDAHEHLLPERARTSATVDAFTLFGGYLPADLRLAGMGDEAVGRLRDAGRPVEERWRDLAPFWERVRHGSYARAILLAVRKFYGFDRVEADTIGPLSRAVAAANAPGIYHRVLQEACGIRCSLTHLDARQLASPDLGTPLLRPVPLFVYEIDSWESLARPVYDPGAAVRSLDDYLESGRRFIARRQEGGALGLKMGSAPYREPSREAAETAFAAAREGRPPAHPLFNPIHDWVVDRLVAFAAERGLPVAVHTGYWGDFRDRHPLHLIPLIQRHPGARFDIFHLGYPWIRETLMLAKGFPNVWLNLCWSHLISQRSATDALREALDLLPTNRLTAFGGDFGPESVELVYGHLVMAKEDVAGALAERVAGGGMSAAEALGIARRWFFENPRELYRVPTG
jgi:predicted TIM-barrel fold metal-dependent hydrolase